jgi:hypothetical protein
LQEYYAENQATGIRRQAAGTGKKKPKATPVTGTGAKRRKPRGKKA